MECTSLLNCCKINGSLSLADLQGLLDSPSRSYALVLSPTRELALQIKEQTEALGASISVRCAALVGGIDMTSQVALSLACMASKPLFACQAPRHVRRLMIVQAIALGKGPHIIVGTPGRVVDHLSNTKGFSLKLLKHLVLDEADRLLHMDFEQEIDQILKVIPKVHCTLCRCHAPSSCCDA